MKNRVLEVLIIVVMTNNDFLISILPLIVSYVRVSIMIKDKDESL
jgi:hypothetical protein